MSPQEISSCKQHEHSTCKHHQLDQITPIGLKFQGEHLYDRNIWRHVIQLNHFNPQTQWKWILDLQITELFDQLPVMNKVLEYACLKNYHHFMELLIKKDFNRILNFNYGLYGACQGGHHEIVQWMIDRGAKDWNWGLRCACRGGHPEVAQMMIDRGARNWNWGLQGACERGHRDMAQMMIDRGANNWDVALGCACRGGHEELAQWMIDLGATNINLFNVFFT